MKLILIIILICLIMIIAIAVSQQYKERFDFYQNLKIFLSEFKLNVSFKKEKISQFLSKVKPKKSFDAFIFEYKNYLKNNQFKVENIKILDDDEKDWIANLVRNLGGLNSDNEINQIELYLTETENRLKKAEVDKVKLCPMIIKLSLLFSLGVAIILI